MELRDVSTITEGLRGEIRKAVVGQDEVVDLMLVSLLCGGHVLLEGRARPRPCWHNPSRRGCRCASGASSSRRI